jgi:hypothetical protein
MIEAGIFVLIDLNIRMQSHLCVWMVLATLSKRGDIQARCDDFGLMDHAGLSSCGER